MVEKAFLMDDWKKSLNSKLMDKEWMILYANEVILQEERAGIFSAIISQDKVDTVMADYGWDLLIGCGKPGFDSYYDGERMIDEYYRISDPGIEHIVHARWFPGPYERYFELSEEFRFFFDLYEICDSARKRSYMLIDDNGDAEKVAIIDENSVKVKLKIIKDYLAARKMLLVQFFECMRFSNETLANQGLQPKEETVHDQLLVYNHLIRDISLNKTNSQSWFLGKQLIKGASDYDLDSQCYPQKKYETFVVGTDDDGRNVEESCDGSQLADNFGGNLGKTHYLTPVYFSKSVLNKYYNDPEKYSVKDGTVICKGFWHLSVDNNHTEYVMVFLGDLGQLAYREQLHWKSYNIQYSGGMSRTSFERNFLGAWSDPDSPDLYFKMRFSDFQNKWYSQKGWYLFKPLSEGDSHHLQSLHIPTTENQKEFDEQILSITKIMIDSLNEKEISEGIVIEKQSPKGIDKFEAFLDSLGLEVKLMITFFRDLQSLRSSSVAHRKSEKNKDYQRVKEAFRLDDKLLAEVFKDILVKMIWSLNMLDKQLLD